MGFVSWWNAHGAGEGRRDWVFAGFLVFAAGMFAVTGTHRLRLSRALARTSACLAQADVACAGKGVEDARAIEADHPRVRLADAGLQVLLRQPGRALAVVAAIEKDGDTLPPEARGDLLLVRGDIAATQGAPVTARGHYEAARLLVKNPELVEARLRRIDGLASSNDAYFQSVLSACEALADAAENGETETVSLGVREQGPRVARITDADIRSKLSLALSATQRAVQEVDQRRRRAGTASPSRMWARPVEPTRDESPWAQKNPELASRMYDQAWDRYKQARDRYNAQKDAQDQREMSQRSSSDRVVNESLTSARRLLAEASDAFARRKTP